MPLGPNVTLTLQQGDLRQVVFADAQVVVKVNASAPVSKVGVWISQALAAPLPGHSNVAIVTSLC